MYGYDSAFIGTTLTLPSFERAYGLNKGGSESESTLSSNIVSPSKEAPSSALFSASF